MKLVWTALTVLLLSIVVTPRNPHDVPLVNRQSSGDAGPIVDLGYGRYQGYYNSESGLNVFKGYVANCQPLW